MKRRHFFAAALPALLGGGALKTWAQDKPASKPSPRRVRIEVFLSKPSLKQGDTNALIIQVTTDESVATYASFIQMYTYQIAGGEATSQAYGPRLRVTPHIEANGKITIDAKVEYEVAASGAAPGQPLPIHSTSMTIRQTVESGKQVMFGGLGMGDVQGQLWLTATMLEPHQLI